MFAAIKYFGGISAIPSIILTTSDISFILQNVFSAIERVGENLDMS